MPKAPDAIEARNRSIVLCLAVALMFPARTAPAHNPTPCRRRYGSDKMGLTAEQILHRLSGIGAVAYLADEGDTAVDRDMLRRDVPTDQS